MIILKHNALSAEDLFSTERIMLKVLSNPYEHSLDNSLLNKPRGEVYGIVAGILEKMDVYRTLGITTSDFLDFLIDVEKGYHDNPYHSFYHAVDVSMVLCNMFEYYDMFEYLTKVDTALIMIAALCHDIGHPGRNNQFEIACSTERAMKYNNLSVLESHSSTLALELLEKHNLLKNIEARSCAIGFPMTQQECKISIVEMILATDMVCHFKLQDNISILHKTVNFHKESSQILKTFANTISVDKLKQHLKPLFSEEEDPFAHFRYHHFSSSNTQPGPFIDKLNIKDGVLNWQERLMLSKILIHAADISNPCRPWPIFHQLSMLVCTEFFRQGDQEHKLGLPVSPHMNPHEANPSTVNVGFIDFVVQPYFETLSGLFPKCKSLSLQCARNREEWLKLATEKLDIYGNSMVPVDVALDRSVRNVVTVSAGTVRIPGCVEENIRHNLGHNGSSGAESTTSSSSFLNQEMTQSNNGRERRKSLEVSILHNMVNQKSRSSISMGRRKSEEICIYLSQPKMVPFLGYQ